MQNNNRYLILSCGKASITEHEDDEKKKPMGGEKERGKSAQIYGNGNENETNINTYLQLKIILDITNAKSRKKSYWPKKNRPIL